MSVNKVTRHSEARRRRVDAAVDAYVVWREESAAVDATYRTWTLAPRDERASAYEAYIASLDREEQAAGTYRRLVDEAAAV